MSAAARGSGNQWRLRSACGRAQFFSDISVFSIYLKESLMSKKIYLLAIAAVAAAGVADAQYPVMDMVANKVIQKYQSATCEQLWQNRGKAPSPEEQQVIGFLKSDPQMRQMFFNQIAGPVMNKMFACGMIP
jgi:hypothetical protein